MFLSSGKCCANIGRRCLLGSAISLININISYRYIIKNRIHIVVCTVAPLNAFHGSMNIHYAGFMPCDKTLHLRNIMLSVSSNNTINMEEVHYSSHTGHIVYIYLKHQSCIIYVHIGIWYFRKQVLANFYKYIMPNRLW